MYSIGFPLKHSNSEYEYPLLCNGEPIAFFGSYHHADLAMAHLDAIADCAADSPGDDEGPQPDGDPSPDEGPGDNYPKCTDACCNTAMPCPLCGGAHSLVACPDHRALIVGDRVLMPRLLAWLLMYRETLALDFLRDLTPALFQAQAVASVTWMQHCGSHTTVEDWTAGIRRKLIGTGRLRRTYAECQAAAV